MVVDTDPLKEPLSVGLPLALGEGVPLPDTLPLPLAQGEGVRVALPQALGEVLSETEGEVLALGLPLLLLLLLLQPLGVCECEAVGELLREGEGEAEGDTVPLLLMVALTVVVVEEEGQGEALVTTGDLLQASLRLRPDRIVLGEMRGGEAVTFLRAINTGHQGSFSTIHANSAQGALDQLALMVLQSGLGLGRADTLAYAGSVVDVVVVLGREGGRRRIVDLACVGGETGA